MSGYAKAQMADLVLCFFKNNHIWGHLCV